VTSKNTATQAMKNIALYGSFDTLTKTWPGNTTGYPSGTCTVDNDSFCPGDAAKGSSCTDLPPSSADWDTEGDNVPDTFFSGSNATEIKASLMGAVLDILTHTSAGTAASVLASREGSGANLLQAVYYPKKTFANGTIDWAGNLQNLWYYIDPAFTNSNIREDGRDPSGVHDNILNLITTGAQKDYISQFYFDSGLQAAMANRWTDNNGDASITGETKLTAIKVDQISNIWEAGQLLWSRTYNSRRVFTSDVAKTSPSNNLVLFYCTPTNCPLSTTLAPYLDATDSLGVVNSDVASTIMQWTLGRDSAQSGTYIPLYRKRLATVGSTSSVWKLGDIINSTPKISTWQPLGDYHINYKKYETTYAPVGSSVYQSDPVNTKYYTTGYAYKGRGMTYTGANDGMLHAFRLGLLQSKWSGQGTYEKARLTNQVCAVNKQILCSSDSQCPGTDTCTATATLGEEAWAFIPKNVLPYLKYLADPTYCHIYSVDLTPTLFDASIAYPAGCTEANYYDCVKKVDSWRTLLIGGMRLGGACREPASTCVDCVKTPISDPGNPAKGLGYSSYFALDITDQNNPKLMWEYDGTVKNSDGTYTNKLGFSFSGPAVARISNPAVGGALAGGQRNGKWFVVFGSGPTGQITGGKVFQGKSDQNLLLHVFDLATGPGVDNGSVKILDTAIPTAFSGSITTTTFDVNLDYSDDVFYIPYTSGTWGLTGGMGRLVTRGSIDPANWIWSDVIINAGPITAAPDMLVDPETLDLWIYFGTGRYFYDTVTATDDPDPLKRKQIFGMKERCLNATKTGFYATCPTPANFGCAEPATVDGCGGLTNVDDIADANALEGTTDPDYRGWYINLDPALPVGAPTFWGERAITNPSVDASGIVYFTTFKPQNDPCYKGGQTNIWAVKFDTGGSATGLIQGTGIIQVSTGSIEQVNLSTAFTERANRRTAGMTGQPPTREGLTVIPGAPGVSKPLFMKERL
jgi:type IV pilus assembly protein PilY1